MRRSYQTRKLERHSRKPAELLLVPMIDIFTVLVTFLLMTAVFSRTVILQLNLPPPQTEFKEPPPGLQLEVMVRKDLIQVADRNTGPLATLPNTPGGYNFDGLTDYLKRVKAKFPEKTEASILLEPDTPYDTLVQVMDRVRVFEVSQGLTSVQAELFPDISIGDAPELPPGAAAAPVAAAPVAAPTTPVAAPMRAEHAHEHVESRPAHGAASPQAPRGCAAQPHSPHRHPVGHGGVPAGLLDRGRGHPERQGHRDSAVDRGDGAQAVGRGDDHEDRSVRAGRAHRERRPDPHRHHQTRRAAARSAQAADAGRQGGERARYRPARDHHPGGQVDRKSTRLNS